eukprot:2720779-Rhodomonas_salina.1
MAHLVTLEAVASGTSLYCWASGGKPKDKALKLKLDDEPGPWKISPSIPSNTNRKVFIKFIPGHRHT